MADTLCLMKHVSYALVEFKETAIQSRLALCLNLPEIVEVKDSRICLHNLFIIPLKYNLVHVSETI